MFKILVLPSFLFVLSFPAFGFRQGTDDSSTMNECLWNQDLLSRAQLAKLNSADLAQLDKVDLTDLGGLELSQLDNDQLEELMKSKVDCNDVFHHYYPASTEKNGQDTVRIGSYNILRTSEQKSRKNLELTAQMIDSEWDLVSLQELQPGRTDEIQEFGRTGQYAVPAHIQLFLKLQNLDPSWGLIISPYSQGGDSELLGFLYRGQTVSPIESEYCQKNFIDNPPYTDDFVFREINKDGISSSDGRSPVNDRDYVVPSKALACPLKVSELASNYFVKIPMTGRFKAGKFETSMISLHLSFRGIDEFDSDCMGLCQLQNIKLISSLDGNEDNPIAEAVTKVLKSKAAKDLIEGTEIKIPDTDVRCKEDDRGCLKRLEEQFAIIKKHGYFPSSCSGVIDNIGSAKKYELCKSDYEEIRKDAFNDFIGDFFKTEVFVDGRIDRMKKKSSQSTEEYLTGTFAKSLATGTFNFVGKDNRVTKGEGREFARFYQVFQVMHIAREIRDIETGKDIIISGDFNLEKELRGPGRWEHHLWEQFLNLLGDAELFVEGLTSLNDKRELSKNYDHFIFSTSETDECDQESIAILNFLTATLSNGFDLGKAVEAEDYHFVMSDHLPIGMQCSTK